MGNANGWNIATVNKTQIKLLFYWYIRNQTAGVLPIILLLGSWLAPGSFAALELHSNLLTGGGPFW